MRQIIDQNVRFTPAMLQATKAFARSKPWRGTVAERAEKFSAYHEAVAKANELDSKLIIEAHTITDEPGASGASYLHPHDKDILIRGRLSVVTYLFLVGLALDYDRKQAMKFAVNLFKQCFPLSFAACRLQGGLLIR
jgi:hypothetical protein